MAQDEKLKNVSNSAGRHGGRRKNAGRKKGGKNKNTIEKDIAKKELESRVINSLDTLINSQLDLATGEKYLMAVRTVGRGSKARQETVIITDLEMIKRYFSGDLEDTEDEYYFISTKPANNQALESLLNRTFGKAPQGIDLTGEQKIIVETRKGKSK